MKKEHKTKPMFEDKSIRISLKAYMALSEIKKKTGKPIKRIIDDKFKEAK